MLDHAFSNTIKGIAMLLILYHHTYIYNSQNFWFFIGGGWCFFGVSLFFFISGFGLTKSYMIKKYAIFQFIKRRFLRLWPTIILCMLLRWLMSPILNKHFPFPRDLIHLLGFQEWFIVAITFWYINFILIFHFVQNVKDRILILIFLSFILTCLLGITTNTINSFSQKASLWIRFPFSFILGVLFAFYEKDIFKTIIERKLFILIFSFLILFLATKSYLRFCFLTYFVFDILSIPFILTIVFFLYQFKLNFKVLQFVGKHSLSLYLIQVPILKYSIFLHSNMNPKLGLIISLIIIFIFAWIVSLASNYLLKIFEKI